jgi:hypothetical protein
MIFTFAENLIGYFQAMWLMKQIPVFLLSIVGGGERGKTPSLLDSLGPLRSSGGSSKSDNELGSPLKWLDLKSQQVCH